MYYNKDALRGGDLTDQEFIEDMRETFPQMNLPMTLAETPALVPTVIGEMERLNRENLPQFKNPLTAKLYTKQEAADEAKAVARASHEDYKELLALVKSKKNRNTSFPIAPPVVKKEPKAPSKAPRTLAKGGKPKGLGGVSLPNALSSKGGDDAE